MNMTHSSLFVSNINKTTFSGKSMIIWISGVEAVYCILTMANDLQCILAIALFSSLVSFISCASVDITKLHEHMTDDELFSVFKVQNRTAIPDYEVVPIYHKENTNYEGHQSRRSISHYGKEMHFTVSGEALRLYLEPVNHVLIGDNTPVYLASGSKAHPHGIRYKHVQKPWPSNFSMYQDPFKNAAVAMFKEPNGKVNFEGTVGNDLVIKPIPSRFQDNMPSFENDKYISHHFIFKKNPWSIDGIFDEESDWSRFFNFIPQKHYIPQALPPKIETNVEIVYPEVLVIVDHETYLQHGKNVQALCKYMTAFWNAVDLRFRGMSKPKVRLNIAGLIIPIDKYGAPYMEYHRDGKHYLHTMETHEDVGRYLYKDNRFAKNMYDFAVAITNLNLCITKDDGCDPSSLGVARIAGACNHDEDESDVAVALLEDAGSFDGILTAAHEIGHLLGSVHDGEDSYSGPGAMNCEWNDGYLMSSTRETSNGFLWSKCSIEQMRYFLRRDGECLRNKPVVKKPYPKILPGQLLSRDEQCRIMNAMVECKMVENECGALWCKKPGDMFNYRCVNTRAPAEGSSCSGGGICLDGKCVHKVEENNEVIERTTASTTNGIELISDADN